MDEIGVIKEIKGVFAIVSVSRKSTCDECKAGCKLTESGAEIEAVNKARASVGQRVRVVLRPAAYLRGSLLAYGLPALCLLIGAVIGKEFLSDFFPAADPDALSAFSGFGAFLAALIVVKIWSGRIEKKAEYKPVVEEILES